MTGIRTLLLVAAVVAGDPPAAPPRMVPSTPVPRTFPPFFVENRGQMPEDLRYVGHSQVLMVGIRASGVLLRPPGSLRPLGVEYLGGAQAVPVPETVLPTKVSLFLGGERTVRAGGLSTYAAVRQSGVWPGVDVAWDISGPAPAMEVRLAPGADPGRVRLGFPAGVVFAVAGDGSLDLRWEEKDALGKAVERSLRFSAPGGASFVLAEGGGATLRGTSAPTGNPTVLACEVSGGVPGAACWYEDVCGTGVAPDGTFVLAGRTSAFGFPGFGIPSEDPRNMGYRGPDVFVARVDPSGTVLRSLTVYGGGSTETPRSMAVGPDGSIVVVGNCLSQALPTTPEAFQPKVLQPSGSFVVRFSPAGDSLLFSSWLGLGAPGDRAGETNAWAVAMDGAGAVHVVGAVSTYEDPFTGIPRGAGKAPAFPLERNPRRGTPTFPFLAKFRPDGKALEFCIPLETGGASGGSACIALDTGGGIWVEGHGAHLVRVAPDGRSLEAFRLLSSRADVLPATLSVDSSGAPLLVGMVRGKGFPVVKPAMGTSDGDDCWDLFVSRIREDGSGFRHSSYLGFGIGNNELNASGALDPQGRPVVVGSTWNSQEWKDTPMRERHRVLARWFFTVWSTDGAILRTEDIDLMGAEGHAAFVAVSGNGTGYLGGSLRMVPDDPLAPFPHHIREEVYVLPLDVSGTGLFPEPPADVDPRFRMWPVVRMAGSAPGPAPEKGRAGGTTAARGAPAPDAAGGGTADGGTGSTPGDAAPAADTGLRKGILVDRPLLGADRIRVEGRFDTDLYEAAGGFDPARDTLQLLLGDRNAPFRFVIPAGDPGWTTTPNGRIEWRSSAGSDAYGRVILFPDRGTFNIRLFGFDFPGPQANPIGVVLEGRGPLGGGEAKWRADGKGVFRYPE